MRVVKILLTLILLDILGMNPFIVNSVYGVDNKNQVSTGTPQGESGDVNKITQNIREENGKIENTNSQINKISSLLRKFDELYKCNPKCPTDPKVLEKALRDTGITSTDDVESKRKFLDTLRSDLIEQQQKLNQLNDELAKNPVSFQSTNPNQKAIVKGNREISAGHINISDANDKLARINQLVTAEELKKILQESINSKEMCQRIVYCMKDPSKVGKKYSKSAISKIIKDSMKSQSNKSEEPTKEGEQ